MSLESGIESGFEIFVLGCLVEMALEKIYGCCNLRNGTVIITVIPIVINIIIGATINYEEPTFDLEFISGYHGKDENYLRMFGCLDIPKPIALTILLIYLISDIILCIGVAIV